MNVDGSTVYVSPGTTLGVTGDATFSNGAAFYQTGGGQTSVGSLTADGTIRVGGAHST